MKDKWKWIKIYANDIKYILKNSIYDINQNLKELFEILIYNGNYTDKVDKDFDDLVKKINDDDFTATILKQRHED